MKKILVVEDNGDITDILKVVFGERYDVVSFKDLIPIEKVIEVNPKLVILDYRLPSGSAGSLCLEMKHNPFTNEIPVMLFSACNNLETIALQHKADAYIAKPFDLEELDILVRKFIEVISN